MKMMQRIAILILITFWFSNLTLCQIKSERQVEYWLHKKADKRGFHKNTSKDSCVIFWEEYNQSGKIIKEYDFPSDMCWQIDGPWEHYYFYDNKDRLIEHKSFGGEEGKVKTLMRDFFYSYPYKNEPNKVNELYILYDYKAKTRIEEEQIDTFYLDTMNTKGMFTFLRTGWKFDTVRFDRGNFIFKEDFERSKKLFTPDLILNLTGKNSVKDFEIALESNILELSNSLQEIYSTKDSYSCEFIFQEVNIKREIRIRTTEFFIEIEYSFVNEKGDNYLTFFYKYRITGNDLEKSYYVKSYIEYFE